jgi:PleD family two-component response regulator
MQYAPPPREEVAVIGGVNRRGRNVRQPPLILIADDNEANREILRRLLEARGYDLALANAGEEALASARSKVPDPSGARRHLR